MQQPINRSHLQYNPRESWFLKITCLNLFPKLAAEAADKVVLAVTIENTLQC